MPDKVLLVCSSTAANIQKAREILCGRTRSDRPELHLLCSPSDLPYLHKEPPAGQIWVFPHRRELGKGFRLWLKIRRQRYREVAVLWCGDVARLRPKVFALACGGDRILAFDERLECRPLDASLLVGLLAERARRSHWNAGPGGRLLPAPLVWVARFVARGLLIPLRLLVLVTAVLALHARRRSSREESEGG